ncbi:hypothetical protein CDAR_394041 [Caerostris darwini]|uniref:Uncharacterized protein n=1 Tax=Caerostris darwini TaxID=1538125 RepID=A0AAV4N9X0_9ARAC|nr:hypothetical protein CDAR_394041 [Caerostris darwini]
MEQYLDIPAQLWFEQQKLSELRLCTPKDSRNLMDDCQNETRILKEQYWPSKRDDFDFLLCVQEPFVKVSVSAMTSTEPVGIQEDCLDREWASVWEVNFKAGL